MHPDVRAISRELPAEMAVFGRSFWLALWATSQIARRDCGSHRQGNCREIHLAMQTSQQYDAATIAILRRALDEVFTDPRFLDRRSTSALEIAEHLLSQAATGERDFDRLKASAFNKLMGQ
jgi:hypothetical protein